MLDPSVPPVISQGILDSLRRYTRGGYALAALAAASVSASLVRGGGASSRALNREAGPAGAWLVSLASGLALGALGAWLAQRWARARATRAAALDGDARLLEWVTWRLLERATDDDRRGAKAAERVARFCDAPEASDRGALTREAIVVVAHAVRETPPGGEPFATRVARVVRESPSTTGSALLAWAAAVFAAIVAGFTG